ncbi:MAG: stage II sporulation protein M [Euryarchaeota archaeon]|nr:stage II sporulation protein M [Euryarchaeota archaeon]
MFNDSLLYATVAALLILALGWGIGTLAVMEDPTLGEDLMQTLNQEVFGKILDDNQIILSFNLFLNNLEASIILFLGGATFGVLTLIVLSTNGIVIGMVIEVLREQQGLLYILAGVIPHGIFEIPAFVISGGLGLLLAEELLREARGKGDAAEKAKDYSIVFLKAVIPLLAIAAFVEGFITPEIINLVVLGV